MFKHALQVLTDGVDLGTGGRLELTPVQGPRLGGGFDGAAIYVVSLVQGSTGAAGQLLGLQDSVDNVAPITNVTSNQYLGTVTRLTGYDATGDNWDRIRSLPDNADAQATLNLGLLATVSRLQGFNDAAGQYQRVRVQNDSGDGLATGIGHLATISHAVAFNGATWDRVRNNAAAVLSGATQPFGVLSAAPGEWAVNSEPAVSTQATATKAAGGAGVRHVCRSVHFSLAAVAAQTIIYARVRDGASGAGTVLKSWGIIVPAGSAVHIELSDLNLIGSANTAMTFEWSGAPVATNFQTAGGSGYSTV